MDKPIALNIMEGKSKTVIERTEEEDGSSVETRVEEVTGGFIKTVETRSKNADGDWDYKTEKSVSTSNPLDKKTMAEKLEESIN